MNLYWLKGNGMTGAGGIKKQMGGLRPMSFS